MFLQNYFNHIFNQQNDFLKRTQIFIIRQFKSEHTAIVTSSDNQSKKLREKILLNCFHSFLCSSGKIL